jgi:secreted trypsin-like serine protease
MNKKSKLWTLLGITSFDASSNENKHCGSEFKIAVFVKVLNYLDWINKNTS